MKYSTAPILETLRLAFLYLMAIRVSASTSQAQVDFTGDGIKDIFSQVGILWFRMVFSIRSRRLDWRPGRTVKRLAKAVYL